MIVWKVVNCELESCVARGQAFVQYEINKWIQAPKFLADQEYYLLAFPTYRRAVDFIRYNSYGIDSHPIYKAEAKKTTTKLPPMCISDKLFMYGTLHKLSALCWPDGTIMCEQIKLLNCNHWKRRNNGRKSSTRRRV